jgi:hypothetical protein
MTTGLGVALILAAPLPLPGMGLVFAAPWRLIRWATAGDY